jgi:mannosyltransferase OCH1-like enzyme
LLEKNPQYAYRYFNDTERRDFLGKYYGKVYVDCYDKVYAKAYRADIFRYALIYMIGGCYVDIPFIFTDSISSVIE